MKTKDWKVILPFVILIISLVFKFYKKYKADNTPITEQILNINSDGTPVEPFQSVIDDMYNIISTNGVIGFNQNTRGSDYMKVADIDSSKFSNENEKVKVLIMKVVPNNIDHNVQNFGFFLGGNNVSLMKKNERTNKRVIKSKLTGKTEEIEKKEIFDSIFVRERKENNEVKGYEIFLKKNNNGITIRDIPVVYYGYGLVFDEKTSIGDVVLVENTVKSYGSLSENSFMNIIVDDNSIYTLEHYQKLLKDYTENLKIIDDVAEIRKKVVAKIIKNVEAKIKDYATLEGSKYVVVKKPLKVKSLQFVDKQSGNILKGKLEPQSDGSLKIGGNKNYIKMNDSSNNKQNITFDIVSQKLGLGYNWDFNNTDKDLLIRKNENNYMKLSANSNNVGLKYGPGYNGDSGKNLVKEGFSNPELQSMNSVSNPNMKSLSRLIDEEIDFDSDDKNFNNNYIKLFQLDNLREQQIITIDINPFDSQYITKVHFRIVISRGNATLQQFNYLQLSYENNALKENYKIFEKLVITKDQNKYHGFLKTTMPKVNNMPVIFHYTQSNNNLVFFNSSEENKFTDISLKKSNPPGTIITESSPNNFTLKINKDGKDVETVLDKDSERAKANMDALKDKYEKEGSGETLNSIKDDVYKVIKRKNADGNYNYPYLNLIFSDGSTERDIILENNLIMGNYVLGIEDDTGDFKIRNIKRENSFMKLSYSDHSVTLYSNERNNSGSRIIFFKNNENSQNAFGFQNMNDLYNNEHDSHLRIYSTNPNRVLMDVNRFGGTAFMGNRNNMVPNGNSWIEAFQNQNKTVQELNDEIKLLEDGIKNDIQKRSVHETKRDEWDRKRQDALDKNDSNHINHQQKQVAQQREVDKYNNDIQNKRNKIVELRSQINELEKQKRNETVSATQGSQADAIQDSTEEICQLPEFYWTDANKNYASEVINLKQSLPTLLGKLSVSNKANVNKMLNIEFLPSKKNPTMENISMILNGNNVSVVRYINIKSDKESKFKFFLRKESSSNSYYLFVTSDVAQDIMVRYLYSNLEKTDYVEKTYMPRCIVKGSLNKYGNDISNVIVSAFPSKKFNEAEYSQKINQIKSSLLKNYCNTDQIKNIKPSVLKECSAFVGAEYDIEKELGVRGNTKFINYENDLKLASENSFVFRKVIEDYQGIKTTVIYRLSVKNNTHFAIECINPNYFDRGNTQLENTYGKSYNPTGGAKKDMNLNRANLYFSDTNNELTTTGFGGIIFNNWCYHSDSSSRLRLTYVNHMNLDERKHIKGKYAYRMTSVPNRTIEPRNNRDVHIRYDQDKFDKLFEKDHSNEYIMHLGPLRWQNGQNGSSESWGEISYEEAKRRCRDSKYIGFDINQTKQVYAWTKDSGIKNHPVVPFPLLGNKLNNNSNGVRSFEKVSRPNFYEPDTCSLNKEQLEKFEKHYKPNFYSGDKVVYSNGRRDLNYKTSHNPLTVIMEIKTGDLSGNKNYGGHQGLFGKYGYDIGIQLAYGNLLAYTGYTGFDNYQNSWSRYLPRLKSNNRYKIVASWKSINGRTNNRQDDGNYENHTLISVMAIDLKTNQSQHYSYMNNTRLNDRNGNFPYNVGIQAAGNECNCNPFKGSISKVKIYNAYFDTSCFRERQYSGYINGINFVRDYHKNTNNNNNNMVMRDPAWMGPYKDVRYHFTTYYKPDVSGTYKFTCNVDDNCQIFINESLIYSEEGLKPPTEKMDTEMNMQKNQLYKFDIYYAERHSAEVFEIKYKKPNDDTIYTLPYINGMNISNNKLENNIEFKLFSGYPSKLKLGPNVRRIYKPYRIRFMNKGGLHTAPALGMPSGHSSGRFYWSQNEYPVGYTYIKKTSIDYPLGYDEAGEHAIEPTKKVGNIEVPDTKFDVFSNYQSYPNQDAVGGDIKQLQGLSAEDCLKKCDENVNCRGIHYSRNNNCILKNNMTARGSMDKNSTGTTYVKL